MSHQRNSRRRKQVSKSNKIYQKT
uniref:Uncharacterized protein n=1 Tax=Arundo donax TaxID=35708 RepID=A0A0A9C7Z6_ARUDO